MVVNSGDGATAEADSGAEGTRGSSDPTPRDPTPLDRAPFDAVVIGGGIVGLATARALLSDDPSIRTLLLLEKEHSVAAHQTGHNSGVIHSGLYYKPGSAKARTCVDGARRLLAYCQEHDIAHDVCGKVVVASSADEIPRLDELERRGRANGVPLERIGPERLREIEPHVCGQTALHVRSSAIVDYKAVAACLAREICTATDGGVGRIELGAEVVQLDTDQGKVQLRDGRVVRAKRIITCGGLQADRLVRADRAPSRGDTQTTPRIVPFRGDYCELIPSREHLVRGLVYPVPDPRFPFLGVHFTRLVHGGVEAGPNAVLALHRERYHRFGFGLRDALTTMSYPGFWRLAAAHWKTGCHEVWRAFHHGAFTRALQRLVPEVTPSDLVRAGCGIRAQAIARDGSLVDDFALLDSGTRGLHVVNAPSPAATASLAIGHEIATRSAARAQR